MQKYHVYNTKLRYAMLKTHRMIACMVVREPLHVHVALVRERECHNTLHVLDLHLDFSSTLARQISVLI